MDPIVLLKGALPPVAAALLLVSLRGARWLPLAMMIGLFAAFGLLKKEWPPWPHELWQNPNGTAWLVWAVIAAGGVTMVEGLRLVPDRVRPLLGPLCASAGVCLVLWKVATLWPAGQVALHVGGGAAIAVASVIAHRLVLTRAPKGLAPAVLFTVVLSVDAALLTLGGRSALLGQLCGAVAAALGAAAGTALWRRPFELSAVHATWLGAAHALFVLGGVHLAELSWPVAGLALVAPALPLLLGQRFAARPLLWMVFAELLVMVPLGIAVQQSVAQDAGSY